MDEQEQDLLFEHLKNVKDRDSFNAFIRALIKDRLDSLEKEKNNPSSPYGPDANGWENITIEGFFEAALAHGIAFEATWKSFAEFLYCGKIYE